MKQDEIISTAEARMKKSIEAFRNELLKVRTGKATPAILDSIRVEYYDSQLPLAQIASVSAPQPRLLVIQPWDKGAVQPIMKAIQKADLGLNPSDDGDLIRLPIPPLTEERRLELGKRVKKLGEDIKVGLRNIRRDTNEELRKLEKEKEISEDDLHRLQGEVQKLTDKHVGQVDEAAAQKEKEILET